MDTGCWRVLCCEPAGLAHRAAPLLLDAGYQVVATDDLARAEELHAAQPPHLLVFHMDLACQAADGLLAKCREGKTPVLAIVNTDEQASQAVANGVDALVQVPWLDAELLQIALLLLERGNLAMQVEARNRDCQRATDTIANLRKMQTQFLEFTTSEARTPVTTMKLVADILQGLPTADENLRNLLGILMRAVDKMDARMDDFLMIAHMDVPEHPLVCNRVDVDGVVQDVVASFFPRALNRGIELDLALGLLSPMTGDPGRISQCVTNLLANSMERSSEGSHILVSTHPVEGGVRIDVIDSGDPVPEEFLEGLEQEDPVVKTRVSVYAAYCLIRQHRGKLEIENLSEGKTVFRVFLSDLAWEGRGV